MVTFNCGAEPVTITLTAEKVITAEMAVTTVDGGGHVTLSGGGAVRVFFVNERIWGQVWIIALELTRLRDLGSGLDYRPRAFAPQCSAVDSPAIAGARFAAQGALAAGTWSAVWSAAMRRRSGWLCGSARSMRWIAVLAPDG